MDPLPLGGTVALIAALSVVCWQALRARKRKRAAKKARKKRDLPPPSHEEFPDAFVTRRRR